ncbi:MAG: SET domain-containing protein-lysine N-methyltransferase [Nanoarchaeota archaeon]|nr:SET domain-containing protein-lysine N-methyltransferase [Nanoarchaeota archaeon]
MVKKRKAEKSPYIKVKKSNIHNKGVYARKDIPKGAKIIEYVGELITKKEADERADKQIDKSNKKIKNGAVYIFELNKRYDIDGNVSWNKARFINHSCNPNAETEDEDGHIWIKAIKPIKKGDEITYNYGYGWEDYKDHLCKCGSKNCVGYILDQKHWKKLKKGK